MATLPKRVDGQGSQPLGRDTYRSLNYYPLSAVQLYEFSWYSGDSQKQCRALVGFIVDLSLKGSSIDCRSYLTRSRL